MAVGVGVEEATPPAEKQPGAQEHYDTAESNLGGLLDDLGQVAAQEHEREPHEHQGRAVAEAPEKTYDARLPRLVAVLGGDQGRDGSQVVRVRGVPEPEQEAYE